MAYSDYYSFLVRMWQVVTDEDHAWRIQLENVQTGEKRGFANLQELLIYLRQVTAEEKEPSSEGS